MVSLLNGVKTIRMNRPDKLNAWTGGMMNATFREAFAEAAEDEATKVVILTGTGRYYCAGVDLSATIKPMHPRKLFDTIFELNQELFESFLGFPKPLLVACNGPAVGASVTSATLSDAVIAVDSATFSTPFAALGVPPEGCSSHHFPLILGDAGAQRMLGKEGWQPGADEAKKAGLVEHVSPAETLMADAQTIAEGWIAAGKPRQIKGVDIGPVLETYRAVNETESRALAEAFLSAKFLNAQYHFLTSKGKTELARIFWALHFLRPLWSKLL